MADRVLRTELIVDAKKGIETLKTVEKIGDQVVTTVTRGNELIRKSSVTALSQTRGAAIQANTAISALASSYTAATLAVGAVTGATREYVRAINDAADAARGDEKSQNARNAALGTLTGATNAHARALENQASAYLQTYGIADDYTRSIQKEMAELRVAPGLIDEATDATIKLGVSSQAVARFLTDQTDKIKGTTIAVKDNATVQERLASLMDGTAGATAALASELETSEGASRRMQSAWDELKESLGSAFTTQGFVDSTNNMASAVLRLSKLISHAISGISMLGGGKSKGWWETIDWRSPGSAMFTGIMNSPWMKGASIGLDAAFNLMNPQTLPDMPNIPEVEPVYGSPGGGGGGRKGKAKKSRSKPLSSSLWGSSPEELLGVDMAERLRGRARSLIDDGIEPLRETVGKLNAAMDKASQVFQGFAWASGGGVGAANARANALIGGVFSGGTGGLSWSSNDVGSTKSRANAVIAAAMASAGSSWGDSPGKVKPWANLRAAFGDDAWGQLAAAGVNGGISGALGSAGSIAGGAFGSVFGLGPVGAIAGGLLGKAFGGLFGGGGKHQDRGMTPATPIYVEDVKLADMLSQQANVSRVGMLGGGAGFVDRQLQGLRLQGMRVNR